MLKRLVKCARYHLRPVRATYEGLLGRVALKELEHQLENSVPQKAHGLDQELIISLTSYRPRFSTLKYTLQALLGQSVKADRIILWLSFEDEKYLSDDISVLKDQGLEIRVTDDIRSYKKIIAALENFPDAVIVTADDDIFYRQNWLEHLVDAWDGDNRHIVAHKVRKVLLDKEGNPLQYNNWQWSVKNAEQGQYLFPVGYGGVLYPPGALMRPEVFNKEMFTSLAPNADDLWLYFMGKLSGCKYSSTGYQDNFVEWPKSQNVSLTSLNSAQSQNDKQIRRLIAHYGSPWGGEMSSKSKISAI